MAAFAEPLGEVVRVGQRVLEARPDRWIDAILIDVTFRLRKGEHLLDHAVQPHASIGSAALYRLQDQPHIGMAVMARTPDFPGRPPVGSLSAQIRRPPPRPEMSA
jgi:hypothetical protein